jgi:c-di-GMP-binding flagellar brake protein YcgR
MHLALAPSQHRRAFRHDVRIACQVVRARDFRLVADTTLDVSTRGMRVVTHGRVLTGEELIVSFRLPRSSRWIDTDATVVRVVHGRRPGERGRALGLQFHGVDEGMRRVLFDALRFAPPVSGSTGVGHTGSQALRFRRDVTRR